MKDLTLLFLRRDGRILLGMKKRRFGAGRWNGVGGKVEIGETIPQAAVRECQEEIGVTPKELQLVGDLTFYITEDPDFGHHVRVFTTSNWEGDPAESEEMRPQWFAEADIPFDHMWPDDYLWMPLLLQGKSFTGSFTLGNDKVVNYQLREVHSLPEVK
jgi:8-oxo-dGTP diphosphatase/2-hydroxy-dATP diphosphatase